MNDIETTRRMVSGLMHELESKLEILTVDSENQKAFELLEEANQNVVSIFNCLISDLTHIQLNQEI